MPKGACAVGRKGALRLRVPAQYGMPDEGALRIPDQFSNGIHPIDAFCDRLDDGE